MIPFTTEQEFKRFVRVRALADFCFLARKREFLVKAAYDYGTALITTIYREKIS